MDLGGFFIHESPRRFYVKCGCIPKGHLSLFGPPEARANPNPHGNLPGYFALIMNVPELFPKGGLGGNAPM